jgi:pimeloyl-ACP methyl ester carboxylesterase
MHTEFVDRGALRLKMSYPARDPQRPTLLFINAVGMPVELASRLARGFDRAGLNFVTWELRGSPGPGADERDCTLDAHASDAVHILDRLGVASTHVLGWCTGASIALFVAERLGPRLESLVLADPAYLFDGTPGAPLGNAMFAMCGDITLDAGCADRYHELTRPRGKEAAVLGLEDCPELVEQVTMPYRYGVDELVRYAFAIRSACDYDPVAMCRKVNRPTLVAARRDDRMVSYRNAMKAADHVAGAQLRIADTGGHYALFTSDEALTEMTAFLSTTGSRAA